MEMIKKTSKSALKGSSINYYNGPFIKKILCVPFIVRKKQKKYAIKRKI
jgi:hypothetical protein